ncbi:cytochrome c biogenesis protein CcdA [Octadecabacter sp. 1_MG-2023]|uniref:cytochrome c biogenesis CcdA family protein n=1 Tax=unclassified Octadecabacter TaxID=196158 RepID=UPI001C0913D7|nr:cytochrome c biogenesis protein CcdA [Octadecabacter sp. 1_MG-2023]MBU2993130.1 cytochrome c biogenesis protein CcdA [Octadecabacter sp. B2R22]MDO6733418.1 cytochrome c biogenesis protein CcdA [Octadecabacter sp. 1_MG-2023]
MLEITFLGAAFAGLLSFFTPCILPMVPFYLSYMAGLSMSELRGDDQFPPGTQRRLIFSAIAFALGVTTIFVLLGMGATAVGGMFGQWKQELRWVAAAVLTLFGLHFLGIMKIPLLYREARVESSAAPSSMVGAYLMGLAFGFGWTPCVGPALASILMIAGGMGSIWEGGALLFVYGLGMTSPFIVAALFARPFLGWAARNRALLGYVEKVMGAMLIVFAILIATNSVNLIADWLIKMFPGFATIG